MINRSLLKKKAINLSLFRVCETEDGQRSRPFDNVLKGTIVGWINYDVIRQSRGQKQKMAMWHHWENNKDFLIVP